jgi:hypothetical protein
MKNKYNVNVRENRKSNRQWTIQRHRQHWEQDTERRQPKEKHRKLKGRARLNNGGETVDHVKGMQFVFLSSQTST